MFHLLGFSLISFRDIESNTRFFIVFNYFLFNKLLLLIVPFINELFSCLGVKCRAFNWQVLSGLFLIWLCMDIIKGRWLQEVNQLVNSVLLHLIEVVRIGSVDSVKVRLVKDNLISLLLFSDVIIYNSFQVYFLICSYL